MQQYMKAVAVMSAGQVQVVDNVPIPEPGDYEMLVKVHACGFCSGTDFHIINGRMTKKSAFLASLRFWATRAQARWLSSVKK